MDAYPIDIRPVNASSFKLGGSIWYIYICLAKNICGMSRGGLNQHQYIHECKVANLHVNSIINPRPLLSLDWTYSMADGFFTGGLDFLEISSNFLGRKMKRPSKTFNSCHMCPRNRNMDGQRR
jgi:hypothetical protein